MRQQEVGCLGAFIRGEDCDHRLAEQRGFKASTKACAWLSVIAGWTGVGATGTPAPQSDSATARMTGPVSA